MDFVERMIPTLPVAFLVGVFYASVTRVPSWFLPLLLLFAFLFAMGWGVLRTPRLFFLALLCLGGALGVGRFMLWDGTSTDPTLARVLEKEVVCEGVVVAEPDVRERTTHLTVSLVELKEGSTTRAVFGRVLIFAERYPEFEYGDRVRVSGVLRTPEAFPSASGRVFDYPSYLRSKGVSYTSSFAKVERVHAGDGDPTLRFLYHEKARAQTAIETALPEPESSLLSGLILGGKQSLGSDWIARFQSAGIVHIVVLSGYNMTIVAQWLMVGFRFLGFFGSLAAGALGIILFALMAGGGATVVRAAILALFVLLARATGRVSDMGRALLLAGVVMVVLNPSILLFDPSFQLSFLASLGLVYLSPIIARHIRIGHTRRFIREVLVSTLATQIAVLPVLLFQTGMLSLVALPANLLVLPVIPFTMLLGFVATVITMCIPSLGMLAGLPAVFPLMYIFDVADVAASLPYATVTVPFTAPLVFAAYGLLLLWVFVEHQAPLPSDSHDQEVPSHAPLLPPSPEN